MKSCFSKFPVVSLYKLVFVFLVHFGQLYFVLSDNDKQQTSKLFHQNYRIKQLLMPSSVTNLIHDIHLYSIHTSTELYIKKNK